MMSAQVAAFLIGVWLTAAPGVLGYANPARANDHVLGPVAATVALVAVFQSTRPVRWVNLPIGLWLMAAPWTLGYAGADATVIDLTAGAGLACLACVRGRITERFNGGWSSLWRPDRVEVGRAA